jgi:hypothetical protein
MKIFNIQQQLRVENKRVAKWISPLLFLVCFISFSNNVVAQQVVLNPLTASPATIACAGGLTIITANAAGPASIEYYIDGVLGTNPFTVSAGSHTVKAQEVGVSANYDEETINITETLLSASVSGASYFCTPGTGTFTVSVSGGMTDYTVKVTGQPDQTGSGSDFTFSGLAAGPYSISVTDACPATVTDNFSVEIDDAPPTCNILPEDEVMPIASYESVISSTSLMNYPLNLDKTLSLVTSTLSSPNTYVSSNEFSSNGFDNMELRINATLTGGGWQPSDVISVIIHYPADVTKDQIITYSGGADLSNITIPITKTDEDQMSVSISWNIASAGCSYEITKFELWGVPVQPMIPSTGPSDCNNNIGTSPLGYSSFHGPVTWHCIDPELEFSFIRTWNVTDNCGNSSASYDQRISVGTEPTFVSIPSSVKYDFCSNSNVPISAPTVSDNCTAPEDLKLEWMVFDVAGNSLSVWYPYLSVTTYNFTPDPGGQVFRIGWRVTDEAGISKENDASTTTQTITFTPAISATIDIVSPGTNNICQGNPVVFRITPSGGSGSFDASSFNPAGGSWDGTNYIYTTNWAIDGNYQLGVVITDLVVAGTTGTCTSGTISSAPFDVHQKIITNPIIRTP